MISMNTGNAGDATEAGSGAAGRYRVYVPRGVVLRDWASGMLERVEYDLRTMLPDDRYADIIGVTQDRMAAAHAAVRNGQYVPGVQAAWDARMDVLEHVITAEVPAIQDLVEPFRGCGEMAMTEIEETVSRIDRMVAEALIVAMDGRLKAVFLIRDAAAVARELRASRVGRIFLGEVSPVAVGRKTYQGTGSRSRSAARGRQKSSESASTVNAKTAKAKNDNGKRR